MTSAWDRSAAVETGIAKSMTDGPWCDSRDLPEACFRLEMNLKTQENVRRTRS